MDSQRRTSSATPRLLSLSQAIGKYPTFCSEKKLTLANRNIGEIDRVLNRYTAVETLYLSGNYISNITALEQFGRLKKLALAGNRIETWEELECIRGLKDLEWLSLEDNPLAFRPLYREQVVDMLWQVRTLDGIAIGEQDRAKAAVTLEQYRRISTLVISNEAEIAKLRHIMRLMNVHQQLFRLQKLDFAPLSAKKLQEMMHIEWPINTKLLLEAEFSGQIQTILSGNPGKDWSWASAQQLVKQQEELARLQTQLEALEATMVPSKPVLPLPITRKPSSLQRKCATPVVSKRGKQQRRSPTLTEPQSTLSSPRTSALLLSPKPIDTSETQQIRMENEILRRQVLELKGANAINSKNEELLRSKSQVLSLTHTITTLEQALDLTKARLEVANTRTTLVTSSVDRERMDKPPPALVALTVKVMERKLGKQTLKNWRNLVLARKNIHKIAENVQEKRQKREEISWFGIWRRSLAIRLFTVSISHRHCKATAHIYLSSLHSCVLLSHRISNLRISHSKSLLNASFTALSIQRLAGPEDRNRAKTAAEEYVQWLKRRVVLGLRERKERWREVVEVEREWGEAAEKHRKAYIVRETWGKWQEWRNRFGIQARRKTLQAYFQYGFTLKSCLFRVLATFLRISTHIRSEAAFLRERKLQKSAADWFQAAKSFLKQRKISRINTNLAAKQWAKVRLRGFQLGLQLRKSSQHIHSSLVSIQRLKLLRKCFSLLSAHCYTHRHCRIAYNVVRTHTYFSYLRSSMFTWITAFRLPVSAEERERREFKQRLVRKWREMAWGSRRKRLFGKVGDGLYAKKVAAGVREVLWTWKSHVSKRKRSIIIAEMVQKRRNKQKTSNLYQIWRLSFLSLLHTKSSEAQISANSKVKSFLEVQSALADLQEDFKSLQIQHKSLQDQYYALTVAQNSYIEVEKTLKLDAEARNKRLFALESALQAANSLQISESAASQAEIKRLNSSIATLLQDLHSQAKATEDQEALISTLSKQVRAKEQAASQQVEAARRQCAELQEEAKKRENELIEAQETCRLLSEELEGRRPKQATSTDVGLERLIEEQAAIRAELTALLQRKERLASQGSDGSRTNR